MLYLFFTFFFVIPCVIFYNKIVNNAVFLRIMPYFTHCSVSTIDCGRCGKGMAEEVDATVVTNDSNDTLALSGRDTATSEGLLLAYGSLLVMALIPIYWGARRSVYFHDNLKVTAV